MSPSPIRNYWPLAIVVALALFVAGLVVFIVAATGSNSELVMQDYYEQELRYQDQLDQASRAHGIADPVQLRHDASLGKLLLQLPAEHTGQNLTGTLHLYRPAAAGLDRHVALHLNAAGMQVIEASDLAPGLWKAKIHWTVNGTDYYAEQRLVIPTPTRG